MATLNNKQVIAANIKKQMERVRISRGELCLRLGVEYSTLTDWLDAKAYPKKNQIDELANVFGVSKSDLVEPQSEKSSQNSPQRKEKDPPVSSFAKRLKAAMDAKGFRAVDLCEAAGIGKSSISQYLSGDFAPRQENAAKIAKAINVPLSYLLGIEDEKTTFVATFKEEIDEHRRVSKEIAEIETELDKLIKTAITQLRKVDKGRFASLAALSVLGIERESKLESLYEQKAWLEKQIK